MILRVKVITRLGGINPDASDEAPENEAFLFGNIVHIVYFLLEGCRRYDYNENIKISSY